VTEITDTLHKDQYTLLIMPRSALLKMRNVSDKFVEKITTQFLVQFFLKKIVLLDYVEKYCRAGQVTDDNMAHQ